MFSGPAGKMEIAYDRGAAETWSSIIVIIPTTIGNPNPQQHITCSFSDDHSIELQIVDDGEDEDDEDEDEDENEEAGSDRVDDSEGVRQDPIFGEVEGDIMEVNRPVRNPKLYFLRVVYSWIMLSLREWRNLVDQIEMHSKDWVCIPDQAVCRK